MWFAGGLAIVAAGIVLVVVAFLERPTEPRERLAARRSRTVTVDELRRPGLRVTWRGYDRGQVEALLSRAARTIEEVERYGPGHTDNLPLGDTVVGARAGVPPSFLAYDLGDGEPERTGDGSTDDASDDDVPADDAPEDVVSDDDPVSGEELEQRGGDGAGRLDR